MKTYELHHEFEKDDVIAPFFYPHNLTISNHTSFMNDYSVDNVYFCLCSNKFSPFVFTFKIFILFYVLSSKISRLREYIATALNKTYAESYFYTTIVS